MEVKVLLCPSCGGALDPDGRACPHCGTTAATRRCAICFDLNLRGDHNCRRCGARLPEEDAAGRPDRLACPGCGSAMTPRKIANASFDECDHCGGLWLATGTVEGIAAEAQTRALLKSIEGEPPASPAGGEAGKVFYRKCPLCAKMMNRSNYATGSGVVTDLCKHHGAYFDRGELTRIFTFIESGGLEKARRREAEALKDELRDLRRKPVTVDGLDSALPMDLGRRPSSAPALDLLRWIASRWLSGR
jgi:Zn-finger nucleic acid-binding protein